MAKELNYTIEGVRFKGRPLEELPGGEVRLLNNYDYFELIGYSIAKLIQSNSELSESIDSLRDDIRQIRVGNEAFVYGDKVKESDEVDAEDLEVTNG